jgi:predicted TIM-barrel fold metal-dependent hydrolase
MSSLFELRYRARSGGSVSKCACHSRRQVLAGIGAATAASLLPAAASGELASPAVRVVDVHHHIYPPRYLADNFEHVVKDIGPVAASIATKWSPGNALEKMDRAGVATAVNSMTSPGVWFDDGETGRVTARVCNEFGAQLIRDFPGRFGMFAAVPLPDTDGSLREIEYALDVLKLDGIGLLTSYAGKLLGDPLFTPVLDELNRRSAVVFVHPTMSCCGNLSPGIIPPTLELPMDTTRAIASLLIGGSFARYPDIRFIFSHGGGVLLSVVNRIGRQAEAMKPEEKAVKLPKGPQYELQRQYYDVAAIGLNPAGMAGLRKLFPVSQLLYGSDEPNYSSAETVSSLQKLDFSAAEQQAVQRDNALRLLPRLQT